jgi:hypothetical protein
MRSGTPEQAEHRDESQVAHDHFIVGRGERPRYGCYRRRHV